MTTLEWFRCNKSSHGWKLEDLYRQLQISKQAHYKQVKRWKHKAAQQKQIIKQVIEIRNDHPRMGARKIYSMLKPEGIGRDQFEKLLFSNGLRLQRKKRYTRTTKRHPWLKYENLISGTRVTGPYEVLVSDITYIRVGLHDFHYLVLIQDVYTRKILGWSISDNLKAENVVKALKEALRKIPQERIKGMIFHSDRGSQYLYGALLEIQQEKGIRPSMGNKAWENAHAESINGVLKEEYLNYLTDKDLETMKRRIKVVIDLYNNERPHGSLKMMPPTIYEDFVQKLVSEQKPIEQIKY